MIQTQMLYDLRPVAQAQLFIELFPDYLQQEVVDAFNRDIKPHLLSELQYEPGPAVLPFQFETEKSRRWYFANKVPKPLPGQKRVPGRYIRTHKLSKGWKVGISADDELIVISAQNSRKYEQFVTGPRQVKGHAITGWVKRQATIDFWTDAAIDSTMQVVDYLLGTRL